MRRTFCLGLAAAIVAPRLATGAEPARYTVYKADRPVLKIIDQPGTITGTALPPPSTSPVRHPFLTAAALAATEEDALRRLLDSSASTAEFLNKLTAAGYRVERE